MILLHCKFTLLFIVMNASCIAFCPLLCRYLEIPSYVKPMKPVIREVIIPLFSFLAFGKYGNIGDISFKILCDMITGGNFFLIKICK